MLPIIAYFLHSRPLPASCSKLMGTENPTQLRMRFSDFKNKTFLKGLIFLQFILYLAMLLWVEGISVARINTLIEAFNLNKKRFTLLPVEYEAGASLHKN